MPWTRRHFIAASAMAPFAAAARPAAIKDAVKPQAQPFDLGSVHLTDSSLLKLSSTIVSSCKASKPIASFTLSD